MTIPIHHDENSGEIKKCYHCSNPRTYMDKTKWGARPHSRYDLSGKPICGRCYARANWKERFKIDFDLPNNNQAVIKLIKKGLKST